MQANAAKLLETTCDQLVGPGHYAKFPSYSKAIILENRYNPIKLDGSGDKIIDHIFRNNLSRTFITTITGSQLSLANYHREGLMLIQYVEMMARENGELNPELITAFTPYFSGTDIYQSALTEIIGILRKLTVICSDWTESIFSYELDGLCVINGITALNQLSVKIHRPEKISIKLDGSKREALRTGWANPLGGVNWINIPPAKIGFYAAGEQPCPVYFQRHALNRLEERIGIHPGLIHEAISETLLSENCRWHRYNEKMLVPLEILSLKLGYLVVSCEEQKLIIRSFLFLTNNGTPEGNKLSELTKLRPLDKKYLNLDTLSGFASYEFSKEPELAKLFTEAGCKDLLEADDVMKFSDEIANSRNPKALMDYFKRS